MDIKHLFIGFFAAAALLAGCQPQEEDFGVARIEVSSDALTFGPTSSSQTVSVTASREWTVTGLPDWIAVDPAGGEPSKSAQTATVTVISNTGYNREAVIAFSIGISKQYVKVFQTGDKGEKDPGKGTLESPYSVDGVIAFINDLDNPSLGSNDKVYVKGIISTVTEEYTTQYGNGTFSISDDGSATGTQFVIYRAKYLGNKNFSSKDTQIKVGDEVIIHGNVMLYGSGDPVYETSQGNAYLYSLNGVTAGAGAETAEPKGAGSKEDPFNVSAAIKAVENLSWTSNNDYEKAGPYYVKGRISRIAQKDGADLTFTQSGTFSNATFYICDEGFEDAEFYAYRVAYVGNKTFVAGKPDIKVGDEVVIYGELMNYHGDTPETVQGTAYLYSLNGQTDEEVPVETADPKGTGAQDDPFNVAAAIKAVENLSWTSTSSYEKVGPYYVKGKISRIAKDSKTGEDLTYTQSGTYSNASFYICDEGFEEAEFYGYRVAYLGKKTYTTDKPDIKVGDEVVIYGELMNYKGNTPETVQNTAHLYSLNGKTDEGGDEPPAGETDHGATTVANFLAAAESTTDWYELTGVISNLKDGDQYGNFDLTDDSGSVYVYGVLSTKGGEKKKFQELVSQYGIKNGGTITIKANRGSHNGTVQASNSYFISYKAGEGGDEPPAGETDHGATTVANFLAAAESTSDWYELTGVISNLKDNDQYGNFDLTDDSGSVYVYGVLSTKGGDKKKFQELVSQYGIKNGGTITIKANRGSHNDKPQAQNAYFVSYKAGEGGDEPGGGGDTPAADFTSNLTWTLGTNAYDSEVIANGTSGIAALKLGTSSKAGEATVKLPAGTKKVTFYGVSWKGKVANVAFKVGDEMVYKQELAANDGASNNSPFTLTVTDADKYTYTLKEAAAAETTMTITTDGTNTRVILFAIKAE